MSRIGAAALRLKQQGIHDWIFGDLFLEDIRQYREARLAPQGLAAHFPLWGADTRLLAQEMLDRLEKKFGPLTQCRAVNYWRNLSSNMLSRMMCDALHETDGGDGVIFLTDNTGAAPYRVAALLSHKHTHCEVISGIDYPLLESMYLLRQNLSSEAFRHAIVSAGGPAVSSLWHQQQKNPPFRLLHEPYGN